MSTDSHQTLLMLCQDLSTAGIWLSLTAEDTLIVGPTKVVHGHPALLARVRTHKAALMRLLEDSLAHGVFGEKADDARFEREQCPDCGQDCLIVLSPRRLGVHRMPSGKEVCPGSNQAQYMAATTILEAFVGDRCLQRKGAVLSWHSLRGALETWCLARGFFLPPRAFVLACLDHLYARVEKGDVPMWGGLTLTLDEWGLEETPAPVAAPAPVRKRLLKA